GQASDGNHQAGRAEAGVLGLHGELADFVNAVLARLVVAHLILATLADFLVAPYCYSGVAAFPLKHRGDVARRSIAEQLTKLFLVIGNGVLFDKAHDVGRSVAGERRLGEVPIGRKKVLWAGMKIRKIATAAAGDQDFFADAIRAFQHQDTPAPLPRFNGTHQASSACAENDDVVFLIHARPIHAGMSLAGLVSGGCGITEISVAGFHGRPPNGRRTVSPNPENSRDTPQGRRRRWLLSFRPKPLERRRVQSDGRFHATAGAR